MLRGNHERYLFGLNDPRSPALWRSEQFLPMQWSHAQLPAGALGAMRALPLALQLPGAPGTTFAHATAFSDAQLIRPHMSDAEFELALRDTNTPILVRGHEHFARENTWRDRRIITIAPVGIPLDMDPRTGYALLDFSANDAAVAHLRVEYDLQRTLQRFHNTGWLRDAGVMGRLYFLEFKLSIGMLVPFLNWHSLWHKQHGFSLEQTFARLFSDGL